MPKLQQALFVVRHYKTTLRFKLTILLLTFALITQGQSNSTQTSTPKLTYQQMVLGKYYVDIDQSNHKQYFNKVKTLVELADRDSSYKATKLMWALWFYDTTKYSTDFFKPLLDKVQKSNTAFYERTLTGTWRFSHDFWTGLVSQVTSTTAYDTGRTVSFNNGYAQFYFYDTLIRTTEYKIISLSTGFEISRVNNFKIHFLDKNEYWTFRITMPKNSFEDKTYLTVVLDPSCSCSCGNDIYYKVQVPYLTTRNNERTTTVLRNCRQTEVNEHL